MQENRWSVSSPYSGLEERFGGINLHMPPARNRNSEPFHKNDMVWAHNKQTGNTELGKVIYTFPEHESARISFQPRVYENGHTHHMSDDIPYSQLTMHEKYHYDPNASIVDLLRRQYDE